MTRTRGRLSRGLGWLFGRVWTQRVGFPWRLLALVVAAAILTHALRLPAPVTSLVAVIIGAGVGVALFGTAHQQQSIKGDVRRISGQRQAPRAAGVVDILRISRHQADISRLSSRCRVSKGPRLAARRNGRPSSALRG